VELIINSYLIGVSTAAADRPTERQIQQITAEPEQDQTDRQTDRRHSMEQDMEQQEHSQEPMQAATMDELVENIVENLMNEGIQEFSENLISTTIENNSENIMEQQTEEITAMDTNNTDATDNETQTDGLSDGTIIMHLTEEHLQQQEDETPITTTKPSSIPSFKNAGMKKKKTTMAMVCDDESEGETLKGHQAPTDAKVTKKVHTSKHKTAEITLPAGLVGTKRKRSSVATTTTGRKVSRKVSGASSAGSTKSARLAALDSELTVKKSSSAAKKSAPKKVKKDINDNQKGSSNYL